MRVSWVEHGKFVRGQIMNIKPFFLRRLKLQKARPSCKHSIYLKENSQQKNLTINNAIPDCKQPSRSLHVKIG